MLPRENFRNFEMPLTTFRAFSWWRKRERQCRVAMRKSQLPALDLSKITAQNNGWLINYSLSTGKANQLAGSLAFEGVVTLLAVPGKTLCHVYNLA